MNMFNLNDPATTDKEKELAKLINDFVFARFKPLPERTHNAPMREQ
jgi:hypothetical protein